MTRSLTRLAASAIAVTALASSALPAFAEGTSSAASSKMKKTVDITCAQTAVDARETTIMTAWSTFSTAITNAYSARKTALHDAWAMTDNDARKTAVKKAWSDFKTAKKTAMSAWKTSRDTAWKTFKTSTKGCRADASIDDAGASLDQ